MDLLKEQVTKEILNVIEKSNEPLETKEISTNLKKSTRTIVLYRLMNLMAMGLIKGKQIGAGKGTWIWWSKK